MRRSIAIIIGRLANFASKCLGRNGSVIGGYWALKIDKFLLDKITYPKHIIGITGSTGKTSTAELINHILTSSGKTVAYNKAGSNGTNGIASLVLEHANLKGEMKQDVMLMELDEKYVKHIFKKIKPTHFVITNITRDQPTRNAHPEAIYKEIEENITKDMCLILNADDPYALRYSVNHKGKKVFFGINKTKYSTNKYSLENLDASYCPICKNKLNYEYYHYGQIGSFSCTNCDYKRPKLNYEASLIDLENKTMYIDNSLINLPSDFLYSAYFTLTAYAVCKTLGISKKDILYSINETNVKTRRVNITTFDNRKLQMLLSKNETNLSYLQSILYVTNKKGNKNVVLGFDSVSRRYKENDISWLYDVEFEKLKNNKINNIIVFGKFRYDILTRLEYAGINKEKIILVENKEMVLDTLKNQTKGDIYMIVYFDMIEYFTKELEVLNNEN